MAIATQNNEKKRVFYTGKLYELTDIEVVRGSRACRTRNDEIFTCLVCVQGGACGAGDILWLLQVHGSLQLHPVHLCPHPLHSELECVCVCVCVCVFVYV